MGKTPYELASQVRGSSWGWGKDKEYKGKGKECLSKGPEKLSNNQCAHNEKSLRASH